MQSLKITRSVYIILILIFSRSLVYLGLHHIKPDTLYFCNFFYVLLI